MPVRHKAISVGTTATALQPATVDNDAVLSLHIQNSSSVTLYLGGDDVSSTSYGVSVAAGGSISLEVDGSEPVYGAVAAGTETVHLLSVELR